jgi:hypothetical protein
MIEKFSRRQEISYVKNGLISALTAVNLKEEGKDLSEYKPYEEGGKKVLDRLANPESLIHRIAPQMREEKMEIIEKARESFPELNSLEYLLTLFETYRQLG